MKKLVLIVGVIGCIFPLNAQVIFYEPFDYFEIMLGETENDWKVVNVSSPLGIPVNSWYQADMSMGINAYQGDNPTGYIQSDRYATSAVQGGTISSWAISPVVYVSDGDSIRFHAIAKDGAHPDRLEVRISTLGIESEIPTDATDIGSFDLMLGLINPNLTAEGFNTVMDNDGWYHYHFPITGVGEFTACRIALRHYVTNAGTNGINGSAVGIDELFVVGPEGWTHVPNAATTPPLHVYPQPTHERIYLSESASRLVIRDLYGRLCKEIIHYQAHALIDLSDLPSGIYLMQVNRNDHFQTVRIIKQ